MEHKACHQVSPWHQYPSPFPNTKIMLAYCAPIKIGLKTLWTKLSNPAGTPCTTLFFRKSVFQEKSSEHCSPLHHCASSASCMGKLIGLFSIQSLRCLGRMILCVTLRHILTKGKDCWRLGKKRSHPKRTPDLWLSITNPGAVYEALQWHCTPAEASAFKANASAGLFDS